MKKIIMSLGLLIAAQTVFAQEIPQWIKDLKYPTVLVMHKAKDIPEDILFRVDLAGWRNTPDVERKAHVKAIRALSDADLADLKKIYEEENRAWEEEYSNYLKSK